MILVREDVEDVQAVTRTDRPQEQKKKEKNMNVKDFTFYEYIFEIYCSKIRFL